MAQTPASHLHSFSWLLSFLLWSVSNPCGPSGETHDGTVAGLENRDISIGD